MKPYLFRLKNCYTKYELANVLAMDSKYSIRIYELLKSYAYCNGCTLEISDLKKTLQTAKYKEYKAFRINVIDRSISEINQYTDLNISYEPIRTVRTITALKFIVNVKSSKDYIVTCANRSAKLNEK